MPPPRRVPQEDSISRSDEPLPSKQRSAPSGAARRKANGHASHTNSLREIASSNHAFAAVNGIGDARLESGSLFDWSTASPALLHSYSYHHRLPLPAAFHNPGAPQILSPHTGFGRAAGIGRYSPTMARHRARRRIPNEELGKLVRKHFNGMSVSEGDVVVDLMYRVKFQDKAFSAKVASGRRNVVDSGGGGGGGTGGPGAVVPAAEAPRPGFSKTEYVKSQPQR